MKVSAAIFLLCASLALEAKPKGFQLVAGEAALENPSTIQSCGNAIIHWDSFSIDPKETIRFDQASSSSTVLNRVVGGAESFLYGQLISNGQVYLINPNGVLIGPDAKVVTSGFIASSLDVLDQDFLQGRELYFAGGWGSVVNLGMIECPSGDVALIGKVVKNLGHIEAAEGNAMLGMGSEVLLALEGEQRIFIRSSISEEALEQSGSIRALSVELKAGGSPYKQAIHCSGQIDALSVSEKGGRIYLLAEEGITEVSGNLSGSDIAVLGQMVQIVGDASIDASNTGGGGQIRIGGDYQGANPAIKNAESTWVGPDVTLLADAIEYGDGGKVVVWSNNATRHFGNISARGGAEGGNGGMVEVSGQQLSYLGFADTRAPRGKTGLLLLDPNDIQIVSSGTATGSFTTPPVSYVVDSTTPTNLILNTALKSQLDVSNVTISTVGSTGAGPLGGSITVVNPPAVWKGGNALTLTAASQITVSGAMSLGGSLVLNATTIAINANIDGNFPLTLSGSTVSLNGALGATTRLSNVTITSPSGSTLNLSKNITASSFVLTNNVATVLAGASIIDVSAASGMVLFTGPINGGQSLTIRAGTATVTGTIGATTPLSSLTISAGSISLANVGGVNAGVTGTTSLTSTGALLFTGTSYIVNTMNYTAATSFNFIAGAPVTVASSNDPINFTTGTIQLAANTDLSILSNNGTIVAVDFRADANSLRNLTLNAGTGSIQIGTVGSLNNNEFNTVNLIGSQVKLSKDLQATGPLALTKPVLLLNNININATGGATLSSTIDGAFGLTINSTGPVAISSLLGGTTPLSSLQITAGSIALTAANLLTSGANGIVFAGTINLNNSSLKSAGTGPINLNGATVIAGTSTLWSSGTGSIALPKSVDAANAVSSLSVVSSQGDLVINGQVGSTQPLSNLILESGGVMTLNGAIKAGNFYLYGQVVGLNAPLQTTGICYLANQNTLTTSSAALLNTTGSFTQVCAGPVILGANISSSGSPMIFTGPIAMNGNISLSATGVTFYSPVSGALQNLTIAAGTGAIQTTGIGAAGSFLSALSMTGTSISILGNVYANQYTLAGNLTVGGNLSTDSMPLNLNLPMALAAPITINTGTANLILGGAVTGAQPLILNAGAISLVKPITVASLTTTGPITLAGAVTIDTSAQSGAITLGSSIDGPFGLTVTAGSGAIQITGPIGQTTPLKSMQVSGGSVQIK